MGIISTVAGFATGGLSALAEPAAIAGIVVSLAAGGALWFHEHNLRIADAAVATVAAQEAAIVASAQHAQDQRTISGLSEAATRAADRVASTSKLKAAIDATPPTSVCVNSPAARAYIAGLRGGAIDRNVGAAPAAAGVSVAVPGRTGAPR